MDINNCREKIDQVDQKLLALINDRAKLALSILQLKQEQSLPVYDPDREKRVLDLLQSRNPGPLSNNAIKQVFLAIIRENRLLEQSKTRESAP